MSDTPVFIERDPAVILAESKAALETELGRELQPGQVENLILNAVVYREVLINNRFNSGMSQLLVAFSTAPVLDYIAALVAVERLPAANAGCTVRFTLVEGHGQVLIPAGTRVATEDGKTVFQTLDDTPIPSTTNSVDLPVEAEVAGKSGNGYAPGKVNKIMDPLAFVSIVANLDQTDGGSDVETDEQLRERIKLAPSQYSSAGSRQSYLFRAKSANALITDVSVTSPTPGTVLIVPLTESGETPQQVVEDIYRVCSAETVRPLTDTVVVAAPAAVDYAVEVDVVLYEDTDAAAAQLEIQNALESFAADKRTTLGMDIIRSEIVKTAKMSMVYDVTVVAPTTNVVVTEEEFANCTGIMVNITGFDRG